MIDSKSFVGTVFMYLLLSSAYLWEIYGISWELYRRIGYRVHYPFT